jgi:hypothetical protein
VPLLDVLFLPPCTTKILEFYARSKRVTEVS